jgi:hypothetical protein
LWASTFKTLLINLIETFEKLHNSSLQSWATNSMEAKWVLFAMQFTTFAASERMIKWSRCCAMAVCKAHLTPKASASAGSTTIFSLSCYWRI